MKNKIIHKIMMLMMIATLSSGCAKLFGGLRKDLDDRPPFEEGTSGGAWPEKGFLSSEDYPEDKYKSIGHIDRSPSSYATSDVPPAPSGWIDAQQKGENMRDAYRNVPSYGQNQNLPPSVKRLYKNGPRATKEDFLDETPAEGSLWAATGQTNYYFTNNRVRSAGDIVSINFEEPFVKDVAIEMKKTLTKAEMEDELVFAYEKKKLGLGKDAKKQQKPAPGKEKEESAEVEDPEISIADVDVSDRLGIKAGDTVLAEVLERYPNGNYKIKGTKRVPYRNSHRNLNFVGVVPSQELEGKETISTGKLYEYKIQVLQ